MKDIKKLNEIAVDNDSDISPDERSMLDESMENSISQDNLNLKRSKLDNTDEDGVPLNEKSNADDLIGIDLDVPGAEEDDENEAIGEEDEENNSYSQADTD
jgi:hypothetical protein